MNTKRVLLLLLALTLGAIGVFLASVILTFRDDDVDPLDRSIYAFKAYDKDGKELLRDDRLPLHFRSKQEAIDYARDYQEGGTDSPSKTH